MVPIGDNYLLEQYGLDLSKRLLVHWRYSALIPPVWFKQSLTHWGRVTHICVSKLTIIGSDNGLSPGWRQAIIWTKAGILLIRPLETNFIETLIEIPIFPFKKIHLKISSGKYRLFCLGFNELMIWVRSHCTKPQQNTENHEPRAHFFGGIVSGNGWKT